jgi:hypothetical protein
MSFLKGNVGSILGSVSPAFGAITGQGALGKLLPFLSPALGIATGEGIGKLFGGQGGGDEKSGAQVNPGYTPKPNAAATGLGRMINVSPDRISKIATSVGAGANQIASAGGAQPGYAPPPQMPTVNNHMQLLNPEILQQLMRHFSGNSAGGQIR